MSYQRDKIQRITSNFSNLWWNDYRENESIRQILFDDEEKVFGDIRDSILKQVKREFWHEVLETVPRRDSKEWKPFPIKNENSEEFDNLLHDSAGFTLVAVRSAFSKGANVYGVGFLDLSPNSWSLRAVAKNAQPRLCVHAVNILFNKEDFSENEIFGDFCERTVSLDIFESATDEYSILGYVGDYIACVKSCLNSEHTALFRAFNEPDKRTAYDWKLSLSSTDQKRLNFYQLKAMGELSRCLECVRGPPGTGKSTLISAVVNSCEVRFCVMAVQNRAIESLVQKFSAEKIEFFVAGNEKRLTDECWEWTVDAQVARDPEVIHWNKCAQKVLFAKKSLEKVYLDVVSSITPLMEEDRYEKSPKRKQIVDEAIEKGLHKNKTSDYLPPEREKKESSDSYEKRCVETFKDYKAKRDGWKLFVICFAKKLFMKGFAHNILESLSNWHTRLKQLEKVRMRARARQIRLKYRAVVCTCSGINRYVMSQVGEKEPDDTRIAAPTVAIVDEAGACSNVHLAPIALHSSIEAILLVGDERQLPPFTKSKELSTESTFSRCVGKIPITQLNIQYRMPEALANTVSAEFYDELIETHKKKKSLNGLRVVEIRSSPDLGPHGCGLFNLKEAAAACDEAEKLLSDVSKVAILTFYNHQRFKIIEELKHRSYKNKIEVMSVDASQGHEFPAVVLTCVAKGNKPGFLTSRQRQCVAVSRAMERFTLVAQPCLVKRIPIFRRIKKAANEDVTY